MMRWCRSQGDADKETGASGGRERVEKEKDCNKKSPPPSQRLEMWHRNAMRAQSSATAKGANGPRATRAPERSFIE